MLRPTKLPCGVVFAAFFALVRDWTATHRHATARTDDFVALAGRHAPRPLGDFFARWLYDAALPPLPTRP